MRLCEDKTKGSVFGHMKHEGEREKKRKREREREGEREESTEVRSPKNRHIKSAQTVD
jgi:hypothetical protein